MIIKSRFKDYYDHVAHKYGGGDPNIVYMRNRLRPLKSLGSSLLIHDNLFIDYTLKRDTIDPMNRLLSREGLTCKYLCVAGKYYLLVAVSGGLEVLDPIKHSKVCSLLTTKSWFGEYFSYDYFVGYEDPDLIELSKLVGSPVFIINGYTYDWRNKKTCLDIMSELPVLGDIGFPKVYAPEQLYQDLAYFIGNKMKDTPDTRPPVDVSNKDRIVQHGFDLKQSFRHRT
jgi:hypothetical protein